MSILENKRKSQAVTIQTTVVKQIIQYDQYQSQYHYQTIHNQAQQTQTKQITMYSILNSIFRKALRKPFQKIVIQYHQQNSQASLDQNNRLSLFQLEIIQENIRSVSSLYKQKLLVDGFLTIKNLYLREIRVQKAYYNYENLYRVTEMMTEFKQSQSKFLLWTGFGRIYQNYKNLKLSKINLSKIDIISNDFTSRELEDFQPLFTQRGKEIQIINSYIIDKSNQNESSSHDSQNMDYKFQKIDQLKLINPMQDIQQSKNHNKITHSHTKSIVSTQINKNGEYLRSQEMKKKIYHDEINNNQNRAVKKFSSTFKQKGQRGSGEQLNLQANVLVTEKKEGAKYEAGTTYHKRQGHNEPAQSQHVYLIRDYHKKKKQPSSFVKIPVHTDNIKIVQIHTGRKKHTRNKTHTIRQEHQIQQSICQNCKFCLLTRERKQIMKNVTQRFEYNAYSEATRIQYMQK